MLPEEAVHTTSSQSPDAGSQADLETPRGTLAVLLGYLLVIIGLWGYAYVTLVLRS